MKPIRLFNKTIVITGASSGLGCAAASEFAQAGASLVLAARNEKALNEVADECRQWGTDALVVVADMGDAEAVRNLVQEAENWRGNIYAWVNNAGVLAAGPFDDTPIEVSTKVITTNLIGYMNAAHAVLPVFKKQGYGIILNNISIGGYFPVPYGAGYSASKFGLRGFSEALREELANWDNIHVCDLFSGFLSTPDIQHAANYTGKKLHPGPVVSDPHTVAKQMLKTVVYPRDKTYLGFETGLLKTSHAVMPGTVNKVTASVMRKYFKSATDVPATEGNVIETVNVNMKAKGDYESVGKNVLGGIARTAGPAAFGLLLGYFAAAYAKKAR